MSRLVKVLAANAIATAGLGAAAIALSSTAGADPVVPPIVPGVPALGMLQDFASNPPASAVLCCRRRRPRSTARPPCSARRRRTPCRCHRFQAVFRCRRFRRPARLADSRRPARLADSGRTATPPVPAAPVPAPTGVIGSTVVPLLTQIGIPAQLANPRRSPRRPLRPSRPSRRFRPSPGGPRRPVVPVAPAAAVNPIPLLNALP